MTHPSRLVTRKNRKKRQDEELKEASQLPNAQLSQARLCAAAARHTLDRGRGRSSSGALRVTPRRAPCAAPPRSRLRRAPSLALRLGAHAAAALYQPHAPDARARARWRAALTRLRASRRRNPR
jgi:hypothetical protein